MKTTFTYDHFNHYDELTSMLKTLAEKYSGFCRLHSLAATQEGREIWCMEITDYSTGACETKPAYYVDGNHHAGEVTGSSCATYFADYLLTNSGEGDVAALLQKNAVYVIPRVSPDGVEYYFDHPATLRSLNRNYLYDSDQPGLNYADVDGDGVVRSMRVKSPYGVWKCSEEDPRLMVYREPDETEGEFYNIYTEGYIQDFNGLDVPVARDKFGYDLNRSYPIAWAPESVQRGAGEYPLCNIETKSVADFIIGHPNICTVMTYHTYGGILLYPPGYKPSEEAFPEDLKLYREICKVGAEETGYTPAQCHDDFDPSGSSGAMDDWCHFDRGIPTMTVETWDPYPRAGMPHDFSGRSSRRGRSKEEELDRLKKLLKWTDENLGTEAFKPWTKCTHPQLGEVEIGGFDYKYTIQNCPLKFLPQECEKNTRFLIRSLKMLPQVVIDSVKSEKVADDIFRVEAVVGNRGYYSTNLMKETIKLMRDHTVQAELAGNFEMVEGEKKADIGHLAGFFEVHSYFGRMGLCTDTHPSQQKKVSWLVRGKEGEELAVHVNCVTGGCCCEKVVLA